MNTFPLSLLSGQVTAGEAVEFAVVVNFSGGKDSSAMLAHLVSMLEGVQGVVIYVIMADTGWEHKDAVEWSRKIVGMFGLPLHVCRNPNKDFFGMVRHRRKFPSSGQRQCTSDLKRGPIQTWIRRNVPEKIVLNCMGLRAEESPARAKREPFSVNATMTNGKRQAYDWLPIHGWLETEVREYLALRHIPLHRVYEYLPRFSCRVCIFMTRANLRAVRENDPEALEIIADLEEEIEFTMQQGRTIREAASDVEPVPLLPAPTTGPTQLPMCF